MNEKHEEKAGLEHKDSPIVHETIDVIDVEVKNDENREEKAESCCGFQKPCRVKVGKRETVAAAIVAIAVILLALSWMYKGVFYAASVNGHLISRFAVMQEAEKQMGKTIVDTLIAKELLSQETKNKGVVVTDEELNAAMKAVGEQIKAQGATLEKVLADEGMTIGELRKSILEQEKLKKLFADKVQVTDDEAKQYMKENKMKSPEGKEAEFFEYIKSALTQQKLSIAINEALSGLKSSASIKYHHNY